MSFYSMGVRNRFGVFTVPLLMAMVLGMVGCEHLSPGETLTTRDGKKIKANDATVKQYLTEWSESKDSIERLADLESDLSLILTEVSKLSDLSSTPGKAAPAARMVVNKPYVAPAPVVQTPAPPASVVPMTTTPPVATAPAIATGSTAPHHASATNLLPPTPSGQYTQVPVEQTAVVDGSMLQCPDVGNQRYKKTALFMTFPRVSASSSQLGGLHQVDHHLPLLIGANLYNRHGQAVPLQLRTAMPRDASEATKAMHAKALARQHRVQFVVSGDVDDMALANPRSVHQPNHYTRFVNGVHNLLNIHTRFDKRDRVFSFTLEVRDGYTGQVIFAQQYNTYGKWTYNANKSIGFGSPEFWTSDYGIQVQHLVARASDEMVGRLHCQPFYARVDAAPSQPFVVIQSGSNHGVRSGDTFDIFQLVNQDIPGQYQQYDTRLIPQQGRVYITEIYPSHSVGQVINQTLMYGQYVVKGR